MHTAQRDPAGVTLGVVLAGGRGTRLGLGVPKALVALGGRTLLERAIGALACACVRIAVAAPENISLADASRRAGIEPPLRRVIDPGEGPLGGLLAALDDTEWERAIVLGVDFPLMRGEALRALVARLGAAGAEGAEAVVPKPQGIAQPLAAVYAHGARDKLVARWRLGERSLQRALRHLEVRWLDDPELEALPGGLGNFFNLNTPADFAEAERRLEALTGDRS